MILKSNKTTTKQILKINNDFNKMNWINKKQYIYQIKIKIKYNQNFYQLFFNLFNNFRLISKNISIHFW